MSDTSNISLGEKIRLLRKKVGLTQKELAGNQITRNMLSLIESGSTSPSVSTLQFLANKLNVPVGYFFSQPDEEFLYIKNSLFPNIKASFENGNFEDCIRIIEEIPQPHEDDELSYFMAVSHLKIAVKTAGSFNFATANKHLNSALISSQHSLYCGNTFENAIKYYKLLMNSACVNPAPDELINTEMINEWVPATLVQYFITLKLLKLGENSWFSFESNTYFDRHIRAIKFMYDEQTYDALRTLRDLSDEPDLPFYMQYRVLCDLEEFCNLAGDVRLAYSASRRKLELIEKCK